MNAARLARNLVDDGVDPKLAQSLAENLGDEIERTVATNEHVDMVVNAVVTREVQQLRVEMHEEFRRTEERITDRLDRFQVQMTQRLDGQTRWLTTSTIILSTASLAALKKVELKIFGAVAPTREE